ncbi:unnamed protein product, partial [Ectocarpus sp. 12 AP-2014]
GKGSRPGQSTSLPCCQWLRVGGATRNNKGRLSGTSSREARETIDIGTVRFNCSLCCV